LHDVLRGESRENLINYALTCEAYDRQQQSLHLLGGLDDYVNSLSNEELIAYVLVKAQAYPELNSLKALEEQKAKFGIAFTSHEPSTSTSAPVESVPFLLEDYIYTKPRETLISWALAAQAFDREGRGVHLDGGLEDYVDSLTNEQIISKILEYTKKYPALDNAYALDTMVLKFKINHTPRTETLGFLETMLNLIGGGIHDYLNTLPRESLMNWALAAEQYVRDKQNLHLMGGLHDYINSLTNAEIAEKILNWVKENPELNNAATFEKLVKKYITGQPETFLAEEHIMGGLHDYIFTEPREKLISWALAAEKYDRAQSNVRRMGGLHDYIDSLTNEQIANKILAYAEKYPELNSSTKLDKIVQQYLTRVYNAGSQ